MRTAIFFASMNISTTLARIAEGQGVTLAPLRPEWLPTMFFVLLVIFIAMDVLDFVSTK